MATHIMLMEPDVAAAVLFQESVSLFMDANITMAHTIEDAVALLEAGVRPDVALIMWGENQADNLELVHGLRAHMLNLPIVPVLDESTQSPADLTQLDIQHTIKLPFHYPALPGDIIEAIRHAPGTTRPLGQEEEPVEENRADTQPVEPPLQQHVGLSEAQSAQLGSRLEELGLLLDSIPTLLSQDGQIIAASEIMPRTSATALARLAGRLWREGATRPTHEWLRFDDQIPGTGGDRRNIALYSVHVAGDITLSMGWDGMLEFSQLRISANQAANDLANSLS